MKKFFKLLTLVMIMALFILTPGVSTMSTCALRLVAANSPEYKHSAPAQNSEVFKLEEQVYELSGWTKPSNDFLLTQKVTPETNKAFNDQHEDNTISNDKLDGRSPYVLINSTENMTTSGAYTTSAITLSPNSYYLVSVDYYLVEQKNKDASVQYDCAFGTFYLNDIFISLTTQNAWTTATFYLHTDKLEDASVTPELYFGSSTRSALGGIYFDKFKVTAANQEKFETELDSSNPANSFYYDFTKTNDIKLEEEFTNNDFEAKVPGLNAISDKAIPTASIPTTLGFSDSQNYFNHKDGMNKDVMLISAINSNATIALKDYVFQPRPHEVYMFQFYSIASQATGFNGFYFMIGNTAQQIANLTDYPHYNGWQLNTVFFIAGQNLDQEYNLEFTLDNTTTGVSGWACIDEFKIYKVNGSYAQTNTSALGVHKLHDQNNNSEITLDIANGNFDLGKSADTLQVPGTSYPYPLAADSWETSSNNNGIINLHSSLWDGRFGDVHPGHIQNMNENNNVYMMHNPYADKNILTSPVLTTTAGASTYISFDAYSTTPSLTRAYIFTAETDEEGKITNEIDLKAEIQINDNNWRRYQFEIIEDEFASSRNYYLRFEMNGTGFAYIDNIRTTNSIDSQETTIDLTNTLAIESAWQTVNDVEFESNYATGLTLKNIDEQKTVIQNSFAYNLTANEYFEIIVDAHGNNAYIGLSDYTGLLQVTTDEIDPELTNTYKLYLKANDTATTVNFQVTLGIVTNDDEPTTETAGDIFISKIKLTKISEDEFNLAETNAANDVRLKILSTTEETEEDDTDDTTTKSNSFFGENWWYLIPSLITAIALFLGITAFLLRKIKFERHIVKKTTSYARDMRLKNQQNKIVAQKAAKVDNVVDESQNN